MVRVVAVREVRDELVDVPDRAALYPPRDAGQVEVDHVQAGARPGAIADGGRQDGGDEGEDGLGGEHDGRQRCGGRRRPDLGRGGLRPAQAPGDDEPQHRPRDRGQGAEDPEDRRHEVGDEQPAGRQDGDRHHAQRTGEASRPAAEEHRAGDGGHDDEGELSQPGQVLPQRHRRNRTSRGCAGAPLTAGGAEPRELLAHRVGGGLRAGRCRCAGPSRSGRGRARCR